MKESKITKPLEIYGHAMRFLEFSTATKNLQDFSTRVFEAAFMDVQEDKKNGSVSSKKHLDKYLNYYAEVKLNLKGEIKDNFVKELRDKITGDNPKPKKLKGYEKEIADELADIFNAPDTNSNKSGSKGTKKEVIGIKYDKLKAELEYVRVLGVGKTGVEKAKAALGIVARTAMTGFAAAATLVVIGLVILSADKKNDMWMSLFKGNLRDAAVDSYEAKVANDASKAAGAVAGGAGFLGIGSSLDLWERRNKIKKALREVVGLNNTHEDNYGAKDTLRKKAPEEIHTMKKTQFLLLIQLHPPIKAELNIM